jgi:hypothetical protein
MYYNKGGNNIPVGVHEQLLIQQHLTIPQQFACCCPYERVTLDEMPGGELSSSPETLSDRFITVQCSVVALPNIRRQH